MYVANRIILLKYVIKHVGDLNPNNCLLLIFKFYLFQMKIHDYCNCLRLAQYFRFKIHYTETPNTPH